MKTAEERFWAKVDKSGPLILKTRCWVWTAYKCNRGYGQFKNHGKMEKAHRCAYAFKNGTLFQELCVCHKCDNPSCVNPEHLFLGTKLDNKLDCIRKGRLSPTRGESHPNVKLTVREVLDIRSRPSYFGINTHLAKEFGVKKSAISKIRTGRTWKNL
jgi:hypothetical protein